MTQENAYDLEAHNEKRIMALTEVADLLRVHRSTISRYAKSGELKSYQIGNRRLFKSADVWSFFENQIALECVSGREGT
ncbi:MAG: helix-turn-helix domain-containing protein [Desulfatiglandaceae bacterium]|jgi:excisionase family DNA binding protein